MSGDNPFSGVPFFGDIARMMGQQGPVAWDPAKQLAIAIATEGKSEPNIDPLERMRLEQLARVAEVQINGLTGLSVVVNGRNAQIVPVNRSTWVLGMLEAYKPRFEALAAQLSAQEPNPGNVAEDVPPVEGLEDLVGLGAELSQFDTPSALDETGDDDAMDSLLAGMMTLLSPMLLGMTAGTMIGHLSQRNFGTYDLPLPCPPGAQIMVLPETIDAFANEWSLDTDAVRLAICLHELTSHAILNVPHIRTRLDTLLDEYAAGFEPDPDALERHLGDIDPTNPAAMTSFQQILGDPEILVGAAAGPGQQARRASIDALVCVIVGSIGHVVDTVGGRLVDDYQRVAEALRRRRVAESDADRFTSRLFGIEISQDLVDRGRAFIDGVTERGGVDAVGHLWQQAEFLPTIAEVDAPGLWLARISLD